MFSVLVPCFSPDGSCGWRRGEGDAPAPSPAPSAPPPRPLVRPLPSHPRCGAAFAPRSPRGNASLAGPSIATSAARKTAQERHASPEARVRRVLWEGFHFWFPLSPHGAHRGCPAEDPSSGVALSPPFGRVPALLGRRVAGRDLPRGDPGHRRAFGVGTQARGGLLRRAARGLGGCEGRRGAAALPQPKTSLCIAPSLPRLPGGMRPVW